MLFTSNRNINRLTDIGATKPPAIYEIPLHGFKVGA
jgi:hypothetical protein